MELTPAERAMRDRYLTAMLEATFPLQKGIDAEAELQALIRAAEALKERFEQDLAEIRTEAAE